MPDRDTGVEMIDNFYAAHIKTSLDAAAINGDEAQAHESKAVRATEASFRRRGMTVERFEQDSQSAFFGTNPTVETPTASERRHLT